MALHYRIDNTSKSVLSYTSKVTTPSICYRQNDTTYYIPLLENGASAIIGGYTYSVSGKTICCRYNNKTYKSATNRTMNYDIPAGTYTPSAFRNLIEQFISNNGNRSVLNSFTVKVNNQTVSVSAGQKIYYTVNGSSPQGYVRSVWFNPSSAPSSGSAPTIEYNNGSNGFTNGHCYVVGFTTSGYNYASTAFNNYSNYSITVTTGIKFS